MMTWLKISVLFSVILAAAPAGAIEEYGPAYFGCLEQTPPGILDRVARDRAALCADMQAVFGVAAQRRQQAADKLLRRFNALGTMVTRLQEHRNRNVRETALARLTRLANINGEISKLETWRAATSAARHRIMRKITKLSAAEAAVCPEVVVYNDTCPTEATCAFGTPDNDAPFTRGADSCVDPLSDEPSVKIARYCLERTDGTCLGPTGEDKPYGELLTHSIAHALLQESDAEQSFYVRYASCAACDTSLWSYTSDWCEAVEDDMSGIGSLVYCSSRLSQCIANDRIVAADRSTATVDVDLSGDLCGSRSGLQLPAGVTPPSRQAP